MYDLYWDFVTMGKNGPTLSKDDAQKAWEYGTATPSASADPVVVFGTLDYNKDNSISTAEAFSGIARAESGGKEVKIDL